MHLQPFAEISLSHIFACFRGEKAFLYRNEIVQLDLAKYSELSMKVVIDMMKADPKLWKYMVDVGDREKPRWDRNYALSILATKKPGWV